ncbi:MAG TPA: pectate lyase, partial [Pirellulaceae bacterium]|nr:pectate lyase [Pirellulaceae bacterium]
ATDPPTKDEAARALRKAVDFFRTEVAASGGYLWRYSADLSLQEGETQASNTTAWVQPPGTPTVGSAYLFAFEAIGDQYYLDAARETAYALVRGQLQSGGWDYRIEFDPKSRRKYAYRVEGGTGDVRNTTTLDDNNTQAALRFLMQVDRAFEFKDQQIHESVEFALASLLNAQYPNGGWPQRFDEPPDAAQFPVIRANYPDSWPREFPKEDYKSYYTFNDNSIADMIATMFDAERIYGESKYGDAAKRAGDFILLAQMPEPQPAWAQQYNAKMQPAWARRFEPAAVTGGESQGILRILMSIYRETGDKKYLAPIPAAIKYLRSSQLPDGQLARFYELKTNRPLYFTKEYVMTYDDGDLPTHYGFKIGSRLESLEAEYERLLQTEPSKLKPRESKPTYKMSGSLAQQARAAIDSLDQRGAWVEPGTLRAYPTNDSSKSVIDTRTFENNVETLSKFIAASGSR